MIMKHAKELASRCLEDMGCKGAAWLLGECDSLAPDEAMELLQRRASASMAVCGDWRDNEHDVYDTVSRFAENNFARVRQRKFPVGSYVVVMSDRLEQAQDSDDQQVNLASSGG
jgi:hypothetical protein